MRDHLDAVYRDHIIQGLHRGFREGFQYGRCHCSGASANMQSSVRQLVVVGMTPTEEGMAGRGARPHRRNKRLCVINKRPLCYIENAML